MPTARRGPVGFTSHFKREEHVMAKVPLTDDSSKWFDDEKAVKFTEDTYHDGNNFISKATGSQWDHEALYFTKGGTWILNEWSAYQGIADTYETISESSAIDWLISQGYADDDKSLDALPKSVKAKVMAGIEAAEL